MYTISEETIIQYTYIKIISFIHMPFGILVGVLLKKKKTPLTRLELTPTLDEPCVCVILPSYLSGKEELLGITDHYLI